MALVQIGAAAEALLSIFLLDAVGGLASSVARVFRQQVHAGFVQGGVVGQGMWAAIFIAPHSFVAIHLFI